MGMCLLHGSVPCADLCDHVCACSVLVCEPPCVPILVIIHTQEKHTDELSGALVLGRLWRFLRIGHAIYASAHMSSEQEMKEMAAELCQFEIEYHLALQKAASRA